MAQGELFNISTVGPQGLVILVFSFDYVDDYSTSIDFKLSLTGVYSSAEVNAIADLRDSKVSLELSAIDPITICLVACAGKSILKPLLECFNKDKKQYLACLKSKGLEIAADAAACAVDCLVTP